MMPLFARTAALFTGLVALAAACSSGCSSSSDYRPPWPGGLPSVADVNGDGVEDLLTYGSAYGISAYSGGDYKKPLWSRKDLGYADQQRLAGRFYAAAEKRTLSLLELSTGKTVATVPLSDKVKLLCGDDDGLWVHLIDEQKGLIDLKRVAATGEATLDSSALPPPGCQSERKDGYSCALSAARCRNPEGAPYDSLSFVLTDEKAQPPTSVTIDVKQPGTPEITLVLPAANGGPPRRVLFDREGHRIDAADLAGNVLFLKTTGIHAIDLTTGATLWVLQCGGNGPALRATPTRLYAVCDGHRQYKALRVMDHNGKLISDYGESRY